MTTAERMKVIAAHFSQYEDEGHLIEKELRQITEIRRRVNQPSVVLVFGSGVVCLAYACDAYIIAMSDPARGDLPCVRNDDHSPAFSPLAEMKRASEVVSPAMHMYLLTWLAEWECRAKRAYAEWESRDPVAEAVALSVAS